jgi:hypothetical protein
MKERPRENDNHSKSGLSTLLLCVAMGVCFLCGPAVSHIHDTKTFEGVWKAFRPEDGLPEIDFRAGIEVLL